MRNVANLRALAVATQHLVKTNAPDLPHYQAVAQALAQVMTDDLGIPCTLVLRANAKDITGAALSGLEHVGKEGE